VPALFFENPCQRLNNAEPALPETADERVHLVAAMLPTHAPLGEVLAVVRQYVIAVFAEPRSGTANHFRPILQPSRSRPNPDFPSLREPPQRNLLDGTLAQPAAVLQYAASTGVDAVMRVRATWRDDVRAKRRL
jgi:hypothetical protein